ncbi:MAG TPA: hypothetical protein DCS93_23500 [Microscillaceae bacterium]|nr:hypothetical protein [Microscillaceae bacterium]
MQKATESFTTHIKVLLYGNLGTGRTSLAGIAAKPLIFSFGNSRSHRAIGVRDTVRIEHRWQTADIFTSDFLRKLEDYYTIVLDDADTIQGVITQEIISGGNYLYTSNGTLT